MNAPLTTDLDGRIAAAFRDGQISTDVAALIAEVEAALLSSNEVAERARERALDPELSAGEVVEARRAMEDAAFARDRLSVAVPRLQQRLKQLLAAEEDARRRVAYDRAKAERDKLAAELAEIYPAFERQLGDLLPRIEANDQRIERINAHLPKGAKPLRVSELAARELTNFIVDGIERVPRVTTDLRLPAFRFDKFDPYSWPRRQ